MAVDFDVIVIGGGLSGGLPAAAYLQKAGLQVLVVEANAELGSFCCTHETWPQVLDSPHVGVSFAGNSPVIADLELERYGFRFAASPVVLATTYRDGTNCLIGQDPARTAENFARHSARDGQRMLEIQSRVHETMVEFNELSSFSPHPGSYVVVVSDARPVGARPVAGIGGRIRGVTELAQAPRGRLPGPSAVPRAMQEHKRLSHGSAPGNAHRRGAGRLRAPPARPGPDAPG